MSREDIEHVLALKSLMQAAIDSGGDQKPREPDGGSGKPWFDSHEKW